MSPDQIAAVAVMLKYAGVVAVIVWALVKVVSWDERR